MKEWQEVINVNLVSAAKLTKLILPFMITQNYGKIVNISSIGGRKGAAGRSWNKTFGKHGIGGLLGKFFNSRAQKPPPQGHGGYYIQPGQNSPPPSGYNTGGQGHNFGQFKMSPFSNMSTFQFSGNPWMNQGGNTGGALGQHPLMQQAMDQMNQNPNPFQ